jgi:DNA-binding MarR family transcriptional regulator
VKPAAEGKAAARGLRPDREHPWRNQNIGRLLLASQINWQDALIRGLRENGFRAVRASHMNLLRHVDVGGTRITEIAERSRLTKQAVGQFLVACEAQKLVKTSTDATDRRAKIVTFTDRGKSLIEAERDVIAAIEAQVEAVLGARSYAHLRRSLGVLAQWAAPAEPSARKARVGTPRKPAKKPAPLRAARA